MLAPQEVSRHTNSPHVPLLALGGSLNTSGVSSGGGGVDVGGGVQHFKSPRNHEERDRERGGVEELEVRFKSPRNHQPLPHMVAASGGDCGGSGGAGGGISAPRNHTIDQGVSSTAHISLYTRAPMSQANDSYTSAETSGDRTDAGAQGESRSRRGRMSLDRERGAPDDWYSNSPLGAAGGGLGVADVKQRSSALQNGGGPGGEEGAIEFIRSSTTNIGAWGRTSARGATAKDLAATRESRLNRLTRPTEASLALKMGSEMEVLADRCV